MSFVHVECWVFLLPIFVTLLPCTNFYERFNISAHSLRDSGCNFAREISAWPVKIDLLAHALRLTAVLAITLHQLIADSYQNVFENELSKKHKIIFSHLTKFWLQFVKYCSLEDSTACLCFLSTILLRWGILRRRNSFGKNMMSPTRCTAGTWKKNCSNSTIKTLIFKIRKIE